MVAEVASKWARTNGCVLKRPEVSRVVRLTVPWSKPTEVYAVRKREVFGQRGPLECDPLPGRALSWRWLARVLMSGPCGLVT